MTEPATGGSILDNPFANVGEEITEEYIPFPEPEPEPRIEETVSLFKEFTITEPTTEPTPEPPTGPITISTTKLKTKMTTDKKELNLNKPEPFAGDRLRTNKFIQQCQLYLKINSDAYNNDEKRIGFILSLMTKGEAGEWQEQYLQSITDIHDEINLPTLGVFLGKVREAFKQENQVKNTLEKLKYL